MLGAAGDQQVRGQPDRLVDQDLVAVPPVELPEGREIHMDFHICTAARIMDDGKIADVRRETSDAVSILFQVPEELKEKFQFRPEVRHIRDAALLQPRRRGLRADRTAP